MEQFLEKIRTHFNVIHKDDFLSLTLINPNLDLDIIKEIKNTFRLMHTIKKQQIVIIQSVTFDDELLEVLSEALPQSLQELSLDFTGCESLRGEAFPSLFERISKMSLKKLKLDFAEVYDINDSVIQGLSLLLQELQDLQQFYLDLYEVDRITEQGYLLLADSLGQLKKLKSLHLDFSANPNITEDNLEMLFENIHPEQLENFCFRIFQIDHIGGGSFFKFGSLLEKMKKLKNLNLTISTFSNINHKGTVALLKEITYLEKLKVLTLNLSNIQLPQKALSYLNLPQSVQQFKVDISCNKSLKDGDVLNLIKNIKNLAKFSINMDFCSNITEDSIEELVELYLKNSKALQLSLPDRKYSQNFITFLLKNCSQSKNLLKLEVDQPCELKKKQWQNYQQVLQQKQNNIMIIQEMKLNNKTQGQIDSVLSVIN